MNEIDNTIVLILIGFAVLALIFFCIFRLGKFLITTCIIIAITLFAIYMGLNYIT